MMEFGVQTFTVRKRQKKSIREAYLPLINLGVKTFEVARIDFSGRNARELRALADEYGVRIASIQVKPKYVFGHPDKIIEFCKISGCKNVVISMLPFRCILGGEQRFYSFVGSLDACFDLYNAHGITLAYHHHNWEYVKLENGKTRMEELLSGTSRIKFVHDTYWTARSGRLPAEQIEEFGNRLLGIHLRDLGFKKNGIRVDSTDTAIGDGVIDFASVLRAAQRVGCSYYAIEQNTDKPYEEIEKSLARLNELKVQFEQSE